MDVQLVIDIHRHLDAPRDRVFRAFVDEDELTAWFGPFAAFVVPGTLSIDPRAGGHRRLTMATFSGSMSWSVDTTYTEVVENERLVGSEQVTGIAAFEGEPPFTVRLEFFDEKGGTRVELRAGPCSRDMEATSRDFWMQSFSKLDSLLARTTGPDPY
ncbi:SRPBCC family protein [Aeromicrobium ginsengisoli]|uniref:SRPBCC domain-containing protein n=1 Tax=Aeromicrobium ginsengisoli TaxID=363867 RepID=A0A5M4FJY4_9ACTN|nr:SRPBCC domain-containing protein [Aeromicrobium ginsengisoli]KAA1400073.1 SRPBCC domain-containing protein [Aeromicrobium ginsengisoli]